MSARDLAREVIQWLDDNEQGVFNICCERCGAPFAHEGYAVAAPPEWFGGLDWERQLATAVLELTGEGSSLAAEADGT